MFATVVSSSSFIGWSGDAYSTGISDFNYGLSAAIGISDPTYFNRVFAQRCQVSPKKYRSTHSA